MNAFFKNLFSFILPVTVLILVPLGIECSPLDPTAKTI